MLQSLDILLALDIQYKHTMLMLKLLIRGSRLFADFVWIHSQYFLIVGFNVIEVQRLWQRFILVTECIIFGMTVQNNHFNPIINF